MSTHLFVYGSLAPGRANAHVLADIAGQWQAAFVRGRLRQQGWGADMGFPGIVPDENGERVDGFLLSSDELNQHFARLDAFEGEEYQRVVISAYLENGDRLDAYVYRLKLDDIGK